MIDGMMMKLARRTCLVLAAFAAGLTQADEFSDEGVPVKSGFAFSAKLPSGVTRIKGSAAASTTVGGKTFSNSDNRCVDTVDGTVVRPYPSSATAARTDLYVGLMVTNGAVTLDLTEIGTSTFTMQGGIWVGGNGSLTIKGSDTLRFGRDRPADDFPGRAAGWRCRQLSFVDADGNAYAEPKGVVFVNLFADMGLPTNVPWTIADGATAMLFRRSDGVVARYVQDGVFTLDKFDVWLLNPTAAGTTTFHVNPGRELQEFPRSLCHEAEVMYNFNGSSEPTFPNDVVLGGEGAVFSTRDHHVTTHSGAISGTGTFRFSPPVRSANASKKTVLAGPVTFSGDFIAESTVASAPFSQLVVEQASFGANGNTVRIGDGVKVVLKPAEAGEGAIASIDGPSTATLVLGDGVTLNVAGSLGDVAIAGETRNKATLVKTAMAEGELVNLASCDVAFRYSGDMTGVRKVTGTNGKGCYYRQKAGNPTVDFALFDLPTAGAELTMAVQDGDLVKNVPDGVRLTVPAGATVTVMPEDGARPIVDVAEGGQAVIRPRVFDYATEAAFWLDADTAGSYTQYYYQGQPRALNGNVCVDIWHDCRGAREDIFFRSDKFNYEQTASATADTITPLAMAKGLNGRTYMAMTPQNRRISVFSKAHSDYCVENNTYWSASKAGEFNLKPQFCVMVFGSQAGGGCSVLADDAGGAKCYFLRGGENAGTDKTNVTKDNPIFKNAIPVWVDGEAKDATTTGLNGAWQILSFPTYGKTITGLGHNGTSSSIPYQQAGNANYAEVLFFDHALEDWERVQVERYLAAKWGLAYKGPVPAKMLVRAAGKGTVKLGADADLVAGDFRGTIDTDGKSLVLAADPLPPTVAAVTDGVAPAWWIDPELTDSLHMDKDGASVPRILRIFDVLDGKKEGSLCMNNVGRAPLLVPAARGDGPMRNWVEYSPYWLGGTKASGLCMRFQNYPPASGDYSVVPVSARTVILAQDSVKGGGTPFMDTVAGSSIVPRFGKLDTTGDVANPGAPIWRGNSVNVFKSGATYLDGQPVDGTVAGFNGRPEILTAVGGANFNFGVLADCQYLEGHAPNDVDAGEILGEILVYGQELGESQRKAVEAYLAWKWCGKAINGYAVHTNLAITGGGTVTVGSLAQMPKFAADFTGTADFSAISRLDFTIDPVARTVDGAIAISGTIALPATVTAQVAFASRIKSGKYTLVTAAGGLDLVAWRLDLGDVSVPNKVKLNVSATKVELEALPPGMILIVR